MQRNRVFTGLAATLALALAPGIANPAKAGKSAHASKAVSSKQLDRGRYMVLTGHCNNCHTYGYTNKQGNVPEQDWLLGSSPLGFRGPWGTTYASNLRLTVRNFTAEQWIRYAKSAKPRPPMPWWSLRETTDQDLRAMYQYIRHLGPAGDPAKAYLPPDQVPRPPYDWRQLVQ